MKQVCSQDLRSSSFSLIHKHQACALQACLSANTYSPERCHTHLKRLYQCCSKLYHDRTENNGTEHVNGSQPSDQENISTACPMSSVVERWLKKHP
ncbi:hypothetical protein BDR04DRAFT_1211383 [Suillus decipiens]|nr:hypothetical protein BDR04DRAFT_1211383 [Suillus decipiens]